MSYNLYCIYKINETLVFVKSMNLEANICANNIKRSIADVYEMQSCVVCQQNNVHKVSSSYLSIQIGTPYELEWMIEWLYQQELTLQSFVT